MQKVSKEQYLTWIEAVILEKRRDSVNAQTPDSGLTKEEIFRIVRHVEVWEDRLKSIRDSSNQDFELSIVEVVSLIRHASPQSVAEGFLSYSIDPEELEAFDYEE